MVRDPKSRQVRAKPVALAAIAIAALVHCGGSGGSSVSPPSDDDAGDGASAEDAAAPPACPTAGDATTPGRITASEITETSGIVQSARNPGVYWVHNDSGDSARAFAVKGDGTLLATLAFDTQKPTDIEDIAIDDASAGESWLYLGDIGDNDLVRKELTIHRVREPKLDGAPGASLTATSEKMRVSYPDGPHNAETLLLDPVTKDLLIVTKKAGGPAIVHRVGPFAAGAAVKTEPIATLAIDLATGGDISRDGRLVAVRNYGTQAFVWTRAEGESLATVLARTACKLPVVMEKQGEAFAFLAGNDGYVTTTEGASPELHVTPLR